MAAPTMARGTSVGRVYDLPGHDDREFVSATTLLGLLNKPALLPWAAKLVATRAVDDQSWLDMDPDAAVDYLKTAAIDARDSAGDRGTRIHEAIEAYLNDVAAPVDAGIAATVNAATTWADENLSELVAIEATTFNVRDEIAGTADFIAVLDDGRTVIGDWKSGKRIYPETALQLAAYATADFYVVDGERVRLPVIDAGVVVRVHSRGVQVVEYSAADLFAHLDTMRALRTIWRWRHGR